MRPVKTAGKSTAPSRARKTVVLGAEALRRLGTAAVMEGCDESQIVEQLINRYLSGYVIQVRGDRFDINDRQSQGVGVNLAGTVPA